MTKRAELDAKIYQRLDGRVALVTGGSAGLGLACAKRLRDEGARVVIGDINAKAGKDNAARFDLIFLEQDVTSDAMWNKTLEEIEDRFGRIDILVNNAGTIGDVGSSDPEHIDIAQWQHVFKVNVESVVLGCRSAIRAFRKTGAGSIINISSVGAFFALPQTAAYAASKACVAHYTKSVAQYCAEHRLNIRCNSVHPGSVHTEMWELIAQERARSAATSVDVIAEQVSKSIPLGGMIKPEEVAAAVAFLASDDARQITGTELIVDGGLVGCNSFRGREGSKN